MLNFFDKFLVIQSGRRKFPDGWIRWKGDEWFFCDFLRASARGQSWMVARLGGGSGKG